MEEKQIKIGKAKMNKQEFLLNKPLLKEINDKLRTTHYGGSPSKGDGASRLTDGAHLIWYRIEHDQKEDSRKFNTHAWMTACVP